MNSAIRWLSVLWPSFVAAGVIEALIFSQVEPSQLNAWGHFELSDMSVYSVMFLLLWIIVSSSAAVSLWLLKPQHEADREQMSASHAPKRQKRAR